MGITVYGAGAIGGAAGAFMALAGEDVTLVDKVTEHVARINETGLRITGKSEEFTIKMPAIEPHQIEGTLDLVLICVKSQDTVASMDAMAPHLGLGTTVVSLQNGINEEIIARYVGPENTIGCLVNWGGDYHGPGHIHHGGDGPMRIGSLDSSGGERISEVQHLLNHVAPTTITDNIIGFLWSKQIWGDFYVANALGTSNSIDMLHNEKYHPIILALFKEGATVALASGVKPEALPEHCFDPIALMDVSADAVGPYFQKMGDSFVGHVKVFSGPWRDIAIRKRPTEVDHILGFIVAKGKEYGAPTPLTTRLIELVKEVERGQRPQDDANLLDLNSLL